MRIALQAFRAELISYEVIGQFENENHFQEGPIDIENGFQFQQILLTRGEREPPSPIVFNSTDRLSDAPGMEAIGSILIGVVLFFSLIQLFWAHSISVIAEKDDQSELMQVLAWIPILQIAPILAAGGSSVGRFLLGLIALVMGNGALFLMAAFMGDGLGGGVATLGMVLSVILCIGYFGLIACRTATGRDRPAWVGLLLFIPFLNFFVYPYLAFHDGWQGPNKIGLALGSLLLLGSTAQSIQSIRDFEEIGGASLEQFATLAMANMNDPHSANEDLAARGNSLFLPQTSTFADPPESVDPSVVPKDAVRILYQLKDRFDQLDGLAAASGQPGSAISGDDAQRARLLSLISGLRADLDLHAPALDPKTSIDLETHLLAIESRLHASGGEDAFEVPDDGRDAAARFEPAPPASYSPSPARRYDNNSLAPIRPFPIQANETCPAGTEKRENRKGETEEEWCQQLASYGGLRHGWYARYLADGRPESMGQYENGLRVGVWTRFYPTGKIRAQAEFEAGMQHGWVLTFDQTGEATRSVRYDRGTRLSSN